MFNIFKSKKQKITKVLTLAKNNKNNALELLLNAAVNEGLEDDRMYFAIGFIYLEQKDIVNSIFWLRGLKDKSKMISLLEPHAFEYYREKKWEKATMIYQYLVEIEPRIEYYVKLALCHNQRLLFQEARKNARTALEIEPYNSSALFCLAMTYFYWEVYSKEEIYETIKKVNVEELSQELVPKYYFILADLLLKMNLLDEAFIAVNKLLTFSQSSQNLMLKAKILYKKENYKYVLAVLEKVEGNAEEKEFYKQNTLKMIELSEREIKISELISKKGKQTFSLIDKINSLKAEKAQHEHCLLNYIVKHKDSFPQELYLLAENIISCNKQLIVVSNKMEEEIRIE